MVELDDLDMRLISELQNGGYRAHVELAQTLGISKSTVTRRIQRLIANGVVRIVAAVDANMIGLNTSALIGLNVEPKQTYPILELLESKAQVHMLATVTGRYDIVAVIAVGSSRELADFVKNDILTIEGVKSSETLLALEMKKGPPLYVIASDIGK
jgi:Lrp/AsnC family transcriptional regulator for asnA, asnC and gidA